MIAEHEAVWRRVLAVTLRSWGYGVTTAQDGDQALRRLRADPGIRMVVLDVALPPRGAEVIRRIRSREGDYVYVIALCPLGQPSDPALRAGADDCIARPFDGRDLRARIAVGERTVRLKMALAHRVHALEDALACVKRLEALLPAETGRVMRRSGYRCRREVPRGTAQAR